MKNAPEFVSYKKVIIFGTEDSGKTSLTKTFEKGSFTEETHTDNGKLLKFIIKLYFKNSGCHE